MAYTATLIATHIGFENVLYLGTGRRPPTPAKIDAFCAVHRKPEGFKSVLWMFTHGVQDLLINTKTSAQQIFNDIVTMDEKSDTLVMFKQKQLAFIFSANDVIDYNRRNETDLSLQYPIRRKIALVENIFSEEPRLSTREEDELINLALEVDAIRTARPLWKMTA